MAKKLQRHEIKGFFDDMPMRVRLDMKNSRLWIAYMSHSRCTLVLKVRVTYSRITANVEKMVVLICFPYEDGEFEKVVYSTSFMDPIESTLTPIRKLLSGIYCVFTLVELRDEDWFKIWDISEEEKQISTAIATGMSGMHTTKGFKDSPLNKIYSDSGKSWVTMLADFLKTWDNEYGIGNS